MRLNAQCILIVYLIVLLIAIVERASGGAHLSIRLRPGFLKASERFIVGGPTSAFVHGADILFVGIHITDDEHT